jgi:hypothetical protein
MNRTISSQTICIEYKDFIISWLEPPLTGAGWSANIAPSDLDHADHMGKRSAHVIDACSTRDEMLAKAKLYIDSLVSLTSHLGQTNLT